MLFTFLFLRAGGSFGAKKQMVLGVLLAVLEMLGINSCCYLAMTL
jgi:hypothetical protein